MAATKMLISNQPNMVPSVPATSPISIEQIPKANTASIKDDKGRLVAFGALIRYTNNQAYFILQHLDPELQRKAITVFTPDENKPFNIRVKSVFEKQTDRTFLPMYIQVHYNPEERLPIEHLVDLLTEKTLGNSNLELRKNVTIDLFDSDGDKFIRDNVGFCVTDRIRYEQVTVDRKELLGVLSPANNVKIVAIDEGLQMGDDVLEFDGSLSNHQRSEFLQYFCAKNRLIVARWNQKPADIKGKENMGAKENQPTQKSGVAGYAIVSPYTKYSTELQIRCLYASKKDIAESIVQFILQSAQNTKNVIFCTALSQWDRVRTLASYTKRPIYRRHTRAVQVGIKWEQIYALNVGMNLF